MAYANFAYYQGTYKGTIVPALSFDQVAQRASEYLHAITFGKSTTQIADYENEIKMACCAVAEEYFLNPDNDKHITSESVGGHSVSYDRGISSKNKANKAKLYLWDTGMLYRGVE